MIRLLARVYTQTDYQTSYRSLLKLVLDGWSFSSINRAIVHHYLFFRTLVQKSIRLQLNYFPDLEAKVVKAKYKIWKRKQTKPLNTIYELACLRKNFHGRLLSIWVFSADGYYISLNNSLRVFLSRKKTKIVKRSLLQTTDDEMSIAYMFSESKPSAGCLLLGRGRRRWQSQEQG